MDQSGPASPSSLLVLSLLILQLQGDSNQQVHLARSCAFSPSALPGELSAGLVDWFHPFCTYPNARADTGKSVGGQSQGYGQGEVTTFRGGRCNMKPFVLSVRTWHERPSMGKTGTSSTILSCFEQGGKQSQENLLSCNIVSLNGCANRHESAKRRAVSVLHREQRGSKQQLWLLSPCFALEYVKDDVAMVVLSKKQQSRSNRASGVLKLKQYPFVIWLPGARRLPPWWHLWKSPKSNFSEVCSYSAPVPPFTTLRWWSALFMDSNGTFFFQNNHCIIGITPLIVCYGLSNTWVVNNSWLSAIWSIVRADWRLTIKAFKSN